MFVLPPITQGSYDLFFNKCLVQRHAQEEEDTGEHELLVLFLQ